MVYGWLVWFMVFARLFPVGRWFFDFVIVFTGVILWVAFGFCFVFWDCEFG